MTWCSSFAKHVVTGRKLYIMLCYVKSQIRISGRSRSLEIVPMSREDTRLYKFILEFYNKFVSILYTVYEI